MQFLLAVLATMLNQAQRDEEDVALLRRIVQGEESAFAELYDRYAQLLYSLSMRILRSVDEVEDTVQEIFIRIWKEAGTYDASKGTVYTWLVTMMHHRSIERLRSKEFRNSIQQLDVSTLKLSSDSPSSNPHPQTIKGEHRQIIIRTLKQLNIDQQQVLALAYYEGYTQSEIAEKLEVPPGTVKSRMRKGMLTMRSRLQEEM